MSRIKYLSCSGLLICCALVCLNLAVVDNTPCKAASFTRDPAAAAAFVPAVTLLSEVPGDDMHLSAMLSNANFRYGVNDPVDLLVVTHNGSDQTQLIPQLDMVTQEYQLEVSDQSGAPVALTSVGNSTAWDAVLDYRLTLMPLLTGKDRTELIPISKLYNLTKPGVYSITVIETLQDSRFWGHPEHSLYQHHVGPIWIAIGDADLRSTLSTTERANAPVALSSISKALGTQVACSIDSTGATISRQALHAVVKTGSDVLLLGETSVKMTYPARLVAGELCLPQDGFLALDAYLSH